MMGFKTYLTIVALILTGCAGGSSDGPTVNSELNSYYESFIREASARGLDLNTRQRVAMQFVEDMDPPAACQVSPSKQILISAKYWSRATLVEREFIAFHELGHCVLNKTHADGGLMFSGNLPYYFDHRSEYLDLLFE